MIRNIKAVVLFTGLGLVGCGGAPQTEYQNAKLGQNADGTITVTDGQQSETVSQVDFVTDGQQSETVSQVDSGQDRSAMAQVTCKCCLCTPTGNTASCVCSPCDKCK
ncbi:hypothetical protein OV207_22555 [Corallococcus sp. BB11-1]|uniref:hypothetical protein n=1 Tax=Corallococcus sp. BB11-1 TaxID=2996783 RepID=UPI0022707EC5|nr:hypothetical protein [Corallococcus sp. BB11-1]MCY1034254.1 hypothetical protein [Corallococcus sp. BB11-1]